MASFASGGSASWAAATSGSWNNAANWSPATIPNAAGDNATISVGGTYTVTLNSTQTVNTLALNSALATLDHTQDGTLNAAAININAGTYRLNGGAIGGAAINISGGTLLLTSNGGNRLINNASLAGNLSLTNGSLRFESGSTFTGGNATLTASILGWRQTGAFAGKTVTLSSNSTFAIEGTNTLTVGSTSLIQGGNSNFGRTFNVGGTSTLINAGSLVGNTAGQTLTLNPNVMINNATILANAGNIAIDQGAAGSFNNQGLVRAAGGGSVGVQRFSSSSWTNAAGATLDVADANSTAIVAGNWNNLGTFILNGGTLTLEGTFTRAGIGTVNRTGGTLNIAGFMDNSGGTLTLNATTGDYRMFGGTISGGTIANAGANLVYGPNGSNRLINGATVLGDLSVVGGQVRFESGAAFTGANATLNGSVFGWQQTNTLTGKTFTLSNNTTFAVEGTNTLTLASNTTVHGAASNMGRVFNVSGTSTLVNQGTLQADTPGQQFTINPSILVNTGTMLGSPGLLLVDQNTGGSFSNQGLIRAIGGGNVHIQRFNVASWTNAAGGTLEVADASSTAIVSGNWNNLGTFILNGGTLTLEGTFTRAAIGTVNRTGGTLNIAGFMDNSGGTLTLNATTGDYRMFGGTISGGTIANAGANLVYGANSANRLINNATLLGDLVVNSGQIRFESGASFTGANATLSSSALGWQQTNTLSGKTIVMTNSTFAVEGTNTLTIGTNTLIRGGGNVGQNFNVAGAAALINTGTILGDLASVNLNVNPGVLSNTGTILANPGIVNINAPSFINAGRVRAAGGGVMTVQRFSNNTWVNAADGTIEVADASSTVILAGNWSNLGNIVLNAGTLSLEGTFTRAGIGTINRTGGTLDIAGFLDNSGGTLTLTPSTGNYRMAGGLMNAGNVVSSGASLVFGPNGNNQLINGATIVGELIVNGGQIRFVSGATFTGANATVTGSILGWQQSNTLTGKTITLTNSTFAVEGTNTLTVGTNTILRGANASIGRVFNVAGSSTLINTGTIGSNGPGQTTTIDPNNFTNSGTIEATNGGRLTLGALTNFGGNPGRMRSDGLGSLVQIQQGTYTVNQPAVTSNHGMIVLQGTFTKAATFDAGGRFVFDYTGAGNNPFAAIKADIISGYAGGAWNGPGINSSAAAVTPRTAVGYAESTLLGVSGGNFAGFSVDNTAVLVRYTLAGDTNIDGSVNIGDFSILASKFNQPGQWTDGDANYDGTVNIGDFSLLASNFNQTLGTGDIPRWAVPEPAGVVAVGGISLLLRRRRRAAARSR